MLQSSIVDHSERRTLVILSFASFIILSLPGGLLSVAWLSMQATFGVSLDALGGLLLAGTIGHISAGFTSGQLMERLGLGRFLLISQVIHTLGIAGFLLAPGWWTLIGVVLVAGLGAGAIDAGLNAYFAASHSRRLMNWLHASFGVGITMGPAIMTAILAQEFSWRWGYAIALLLQVGMVVFYLMTQREWRAQAAIATDEVSEGNGTLPPANVFRLPLVWLSMLLFFFAAGTEATAGYWAYALFTESRGIPLETAGLWVSIYWGSFTVGRVLFGVVADRLSVIPLLRLVMLGAATGALLLWWNPSNWVSFFGLALTGFVLAPIFPLLVSETPRRIGRRHFRRAIGLQIGMAGMGLSLLPGLAGVLAEKVTLEVIGPYLLVVAMLMFVAHELVLRRER